jgi:hypothetical protein
MRFRHLIALASILVLAAEVRAHAVDHAPEILSRVAPHVEKVCGAKFAKPPVVRELSSDRAKSLFAEDVRPELERRYAGATPNQMRYLMSGAASASVQSCVARYSITGKAIILVRSGFDRQRKALGLDEAQASVLLTAALAHECVHALDDRRFDLLKLFRGTADEEALRAVNLVTEGRAVFFGRKVAATLGVPEKTRNRLPGGEKPEGVREWTLHLTYATGLDFVERLVERGGIALADRAMRVPPVLTHFVCQPDRWPDGKIDPRPLALLTKAGLADKAKPLSEIQLRTRYASLMDGPAARVLIDPYRGGLQIVVDGSNLAILAFADEEGATRYAARPGKDVVVRREGTLVIRAAGPTAAKVISLVTSATR